MDKKKIFLGVAWPYVNGDIHIGHLAGYLLPADIFARFHRFIGNDVLMVSGSDCFGTPITLEADKRKVTPREIVEEYHPKNVALFRDLGLSFDLYTKTDTPNHKKIAQDFFVRLLEEGFIFKNITDQYYASEETRFLPDRYVEGKCPHCGYEGARSDQCDGCGNVLAPGELLNPRSTTSGSALELKPTEHYFFDWPKLQLFLEKYVKSQEGKWREWVYQETLGWLRKGLKPRAITRDLDWGVEIPIERIPKELQIEGAEHKRIYVWFEAVIGYLSASFEWAEERRSTQTDTQNHAEGQYIDVGRQYIGGEEKWKDYWYGSQAFHYYFMGKDNLVFHTLFWPGQLHAYDEELHLPDFPAINQFLNLEGQKFSKSRGIIVDSRYIVEKYGLDPVRFYLCLIMPENSDANFTWEHFVRTVNDILIGNFGNFINRTLVLAKKIYGSPTSIDSSKNYRSSTSIDGEVVDKVIRLVRGAKSALENCEFKKYVETVLALSDFGNKYLSKEEPWALKQDDKRFQQAMANSIFIVLALTLITKPLLVDSTKKISKILGVEIISWPEDEIQALKDLLKKVRISEVKPLFTKIDEKVIEEEREKIKT